MVFLKVVLIPLVISTIILQEIRSEKIDFKKIFHTPTKKFDKLQILERSSFEPDDPVDDGKIRKKNENNHQHHSQPKAVANAQVLLNFDNDHEDKPKNSRRCPCLYPYGHHYPSIHPYSIYHPPYIYHPFHPYHSGCFCLPPYFINHQNSFTTTVKPTEGSTQKPVYKSIMSDYDYENNFKTVLSEETTRKPIREPTRGSMDETTHKPTERPGYNPVYRATNGPSFRPTRGPNQKSSRGPTRTTIENENHVEIREPTQSTINGLIHKGITEMTQGLMQGSTWKSFDYDDYLGLTTEGNERLIFDSTRGENREPTDDPTGGSTLDPVNTTNKPGDGPTQKPVYKLIVSDYDYENNFEAVSSGGTTRKPIREPTRGSMDETTHKPSVRPGYNPVYRATNGPSFRPTRGPNQKSSRGPTRITIENENHIENHEPTQSTINGLIHKGIPEMTQGLIRGSTRKSFDFDYSLGLTTEGNERLIFDSTRGENREPTDDPTGRSTLDPVNTTNKPGDGPMQKPVYKLIVNDYDYENNFEAVSSGGTTRKPIREPTRESMDEATHKPTVRPGYNPVYRATNGPSFRPARGPNQKSSRGPTRTTTEKENHVENCEPIQSTINGLTYKGIPETTQGLIRGSTRKSFDYDYSLGLTTEGNERLIFDSTRGENREPADDPTGGSTLDPVNTTNKPGDGPTQKPVYKLIVNDYDYENNFEAVSSGGTTRKPIREPTRGSMDETTHKPSVRPGYNPVYRATNGPSFRPTRGPNQKSSRGPTRTTTENENHIENHEPTQSAINGLTHKGIPETTQGLIRGSTWKSFDYDDSLGLTTEGNERLIFDSIRGENREPTDDPTGGSTLDPVNTTNKPGDGPTQKPVYKLIVSDYDYENNFKAVSSGGTTRKPIREPTRESMDETTHKPSVRPGYNPVYRATNRPSFRPTRGPNQKSSRGPTRTTTEKENHIENHEPNQSTINGLIHKGIPEMIQGLIQGSTRKSFDFDYSLGLTTEGNERLIFDSTRGENREPTDDPTGGSTLDPVNTTNKPGDEPTQKPVYKLIVSDYDYENNFEAVSSGGTTRKPIREPTRGSMDETTHKPSVRPGYKPVYRATNGPSFRPTRGPNQKSSRGPTRTTTENENHIENLEPNQSTINGLTHKGIPETTQGLIRVSTEKSFDFDYSLGLTTEGNERLIFDSTRGENREPTNDPTGGSTLDPVNTTNKPGDEPTQKPVYKLIVSDYDYENNFEAVSSGGTTRKPIREPTRGSMDETTHKPSVRPGYKPVYRAMNGPSFRPTRGPNQKSSRGPTRTTTENENHIENREPNQSTMNGLTHKGIPETTQGLIRVSTEKSFDFDYSLGLTTEGNERLIFDSTRGENREPTDDPTGGSTLDPVNTTNKPGDEPTQKPVYKLIVSDYDYENNFKAVSSGGTPRKPIREPTRESMDETTHKPAVRPGYKPVYRATNGPSFRPARGPNQKSSRGPTRTTIENENHVENREPTQSTINWLTHKGIPETTQGLIRVSTEKSFDFDYSLGLTTEGNERLIFDSTRGENREPTDDPTGGSTLDPVNTTNKPGDGPTQKPVYNSIVDDYDYENNFEAVSSGGTTRKPIREPTRVSMDETTRKPSVRPGYNPVYRATNGPSFRPNQNTINGLISKPISETTQGLIHVSTQKPNCFDGDLFKLNTMDMREFIRKEFLLIIEKMLEYLLTDHPICDMDFTKKEKCEIADSLHLIINHFKNDNFKFKDDYPKWDKSGILNNLMVIFPFNLLLEKNNNIQKNYVLKYLQEDYSGNDQHKFIEEKLKNKIVDFFLENLTQSRFKRMDDQDTLVKVQRLFLYCFDRRLKEIQNSRYDEIEKYLTGDFKVLTENEPIGCCGCCQGLTNGKFPVDVDALIGENRFCPTCSKYTKELNDF